MRLGIDFGTSNSAVAVVGSDGHPRMLELVPGESVQRTVIYCDPRGQLSFGNEGFRRYVEDDLEGRLIRSLKSFLSQDVPRTHLGGRAYAFTDLVTLYLRYLVRESERITGERVTAVVLGRPVNFNVDASLNDLALSRLVEAVQAAEVPACTLELEPVAAARRYEHQLDAERLVLVGDFGGGTADFAILRVGPARRTRRDRADDILGTSGVALAGDALDACFLDTFLMRYFGRGATYTQLEGGGTGTWEHPIQTWIQRLYYIHLLRSDDLRRRLEYVQPRMHDPTVIRRLLKLIFDDLGYPMAWAIEATKKTLSAEGHARFEFDEFYSPALNIVEQVDLVRFEQGCAGVLEAYGQGIDQVLDAAGLTEQGIDDVFLTGGTSQLPFVRGLFARRFGEAKLRDGDSLTSVCEGLALGA